MRRRISRPRTRRRCAKKSLIIPSPAIRAFSLLFVPMRGGGMEIFMAEQKYNKVVLAYSGGLDTSIIIPWLKENYGCEVIAVAGNVGQKSELEGLREKAIKTGASKIYIEDLTAEFVNDFIFPTLQAGAVYEGKYLLGTSFARPIIAKRIVEIAEMEGADAICHGCTGKGNDQVRFELTIKAFAPDMPIIAPWRIWELKSREDEIAYAEERGIPLKITRETNYSKDMNLWHLSHEGLDLEDPANEPDYDKILELGVSPEKAPDKAAYLTISFEGGIPVALDGVKMDGAELIETLNKIGGENGVGIVDMVENRLVGMKSRGIYETPGGTILYHAHDVLETLCLDRETAHYKRLVAEKFAEIVYYGQWYSPLREALSAFVSETQKTVTGDVKLKIYKGNIINAGVTSPYSLYDEDIATFDEDEVYNQNDSAGFINLFGLPIKVKARLDMKNKK
jgi:argininosuccinate synthase